MFNYLKKTKNSKIYYFLISFIFIRIYELIWVYIINFKGHSLYKEWNRKFASKKNLFEKIPQEIDSIKYKKFSSSLISQIDDKLIIELKNKLLNNEIYEDKNNVAANEKPFSVDLYPYLNFETRRQIIELALDKEIITSVGNYLKTFPILAKVMVYLNIPRENTKERSSMHWHKDEFGYKSVDLFMSLCKIDENNGPFYYSTDPEDTGVFYKVKPKEQLSRPGERGKITNKEFLNYTDKKYINKFEGEIGSVIFIDSMSTYHKGGFCLKNDRLMLRLSYQTPDCVRLKDQINKKFYYFDDIEKFNFPIKFKNYLFMFRSSLIKDFIKKFLIKFYRFMSYNPSKL